MRDHRTRTVAVIGVGQMGISQAPGLPSDFEIISFVKRGSIKHLLDELKDFKVLPNLWEALPLSETRFGINQYAPSDLRRAHRGAMDTGAHIFVEQPLAATVAEEGLNTAGIES